jgi:hypothetical protein
LVLIDVKYGYDLKPRKQKYLRLNSPQPLRKPSNYRMIQYYSHSRKLHFKNLNTIVFKSLHLEPFHQPFLWWVFQYRVSQTICLGWLWAGVLLISASWIARIIGMSHWHLVSLGTLKIFPKYICMCLYEYILGMNT